MSLKEVETTEHVLGDFVLYFDGKK